MVRIHIWDGATSIGGNKIVLEDTAKGAAIMLDFGKNFAAENRYFDEFLTPRTPKGIHDFISLGLLPNVSGLYREDLIIDRSFEAQSYQLSYPVAALLVSHAHMDHVGYIPYVRTDIPVVCSATSAAIMKAIQDTSQGLETELTFTELREPSSRYGHSILVAKGAKNRVFRPFALLGTVSDPRTYHDMWLTVHKKEKKETDWRPPQFLPNRELHFMGFRIRYWNVDHSIPGALAYAIESSKGWIVYTGDLRVHGRQAKETRAFFKEVAELNPEILLCEGTHPHGGEPTSEEEVFERALNAVSKTKGIVISDFGPRNVERLLSFLHIAEETQRMLVITTKDYVVLRYLHAADSRIPDPYTHPRILVYVSPKASPNTWETNVIEALPEPKRVLPRQVSLNPGDYVLCFSYYDFTNLLDMDVKGGTYIYSSSEAFNEEMKLDQEKVLNWIKHFDLQVRGRIGPTTNGNEDPFHASGHIHGDGLVEMVETIKPRHLVPIHTETPEFFKRFESICTVLYPNPNEPIVI